MKMVKVLVSACLLGQRVRYNGEIGAVKNNILTRWQCQGLVITFCPEVFAGLPVPRPPAELVGGDGRAVLQGRAIVMNNKGQDKTDYFLDGAQKSLELVNSKRIKLAVLKDGSPSCGKTYIYDGSFSKIKKPGRGITTFLLEEKGVRVFSEHEIGKASEFLKSLIGNCDIHEFE